MGITMGMKIAVSIPEAVFRSAELLAKRLRKSRSRLYAEAVAEYLVRHDPEAVRAALDEFYRDAVPDPAMTALTIDALRKQPW